MTWRLRRYYGQGSLHFITFSCYRRRPLLALPARRRVALDNSEGVVKRHVSPVQRRQAGGRPNFPSRGRQS